MDLEELYDKLYRYCYMKTRHPQTAEDLTQEEENAIILKEIKQAQETVEKKPPVQAAIKKKVPER